MPLERRSSRRLFLGSMAAACALPWAARAAQTAPSDHGRIDPPVPVPNIPIVRQDGVTTNLFDLVNHRATALQLMFTSCTTTCPIQGAIFARVQGLIPYQVGRGIQLVSLSVDPKNDTPQALSRWLRRFHRRPGWEAGAPQIADTDQLQDFAGRGRDPSDNHSTRVQILNRNGQLVWRTGELPSAEEIAAILRHV